MTMRNVIGGGDEAERSEQRRSRKEVQSVWEFASVVAFLDSFEDVLKLAHPFDPAELERALVELESVAEEHRQKVAAAAATTQTTDRPPATDTGDVRDASIELASRDVVMDVDGGGDHSSNGLARQNAEKDETSEPHENGHSKADGIKGRGKRGDDVEGDDEDEDAEGSKKRRRRDQASSDDDQAEDDDDGKESNSDEDEGKKKKKAKSEKPTEPWTENGSYQYIAGIHIALLKNIIGRSASLTLERWEGYLERELNKQWNETMEVYFGSDNPLSDSNYLTLPLRTKVLVLKAMCDLQFDLNGVLLTAIHEIEAKGERVQLRPTTLGRDGRGRLYWYFSGGRHPRLYREQLPLLEDDHLTVITPGKWKQVCSTLPEMEALADDLADNKSKQARRLATTIMHDVVPPLFARELEEEKAAKKKARSLARSLIRSGGIDARNVVNSRSRRARKAVDYTYDTKDLDKAIKEYNEERYLDSGSDESEEEGTEREKKVQAKPRQLRSVAPGTRSSSRIQQKEQKRKRSSAAG